MKKGYKEQPYPKAAYTAMFSEVDKNVGQIMTLLKEKGVLENTIIIFSSDNGLYNVGETIRNFSTVMDRFVAKR